HWGAALANAHRQRGDARPCLLADQARNRRRPWPAVRSGGDVFPALGCASLHRPLRRLRRYARRGSGVFPLWGNALRRGPLLAKPEGGVRCLTNRNTLPSPPPPKTRSALSSTVRRGPGENAP